MSGASRQSSGSPGAGRTGRRAGIAVAILAAAISALLYFLTLFPGVGDRAASGDAIEFQTVGRLLSIPHEPGYPQYVLLTFLWSWLPLPLTLATKINVFSAVCAVSAGLFLLAAGRSFCADRVAVLLVTLLILTGPDLWRLATQAEVYTLHVLWVAVFFWASLRWERTPSRPRLIVLLFTYALAFGNHLTMIALLPALAFLLLVRQPGLVRDLSAWAWAVAAGLTGAAQYLLLVWRSYVPHPTLLRRFPLRSGPSEILAYITGDRFVEKHWLPAGLGEWAARTGEALLHGAVQATPAIAALAVVGLLATWRRQRPTAVFLLVAAGSVLLFAAAYDIRSWLLYCMPAWLAAAILAARGAEHVMERLGRRRLLVPVALALVLVVRIGLGVERHVAGNPADLARVLHTIPPDSSIVAAGGQRTIRLLSEYYTYGLELPAMERLDFVSAQKDLPEKLLNLRPKPLYFRDPTVVRVFQNRLIDFRPWAVTEDGGGPVFVTGTEDPLSELTLEVLAEGPIKITLRERSRELTDRWAFYLLFVSARERRSRGLEAIAVDDPDWPARVARMHSHLETGDVVVLIAPLLRQADRQALGELLSVRGLEPFPADAERLIAAWRHRGNRHKARILPDPTGTLLLELGTL